MGIDKTRFISNVGDDLLCTICKKVFEDPVKIDCEHSFCFKCIENRLETEKSCPIDGKEILYFNLKENNLLIKLLSKLKITCEFASLGCNEIIYLSLLYYHTAKCFYNPSVTHACIGGCGSQLTAQQIKNHRCVETLKIEINRLKEENKCRQRENETDVEVRVINGFCLIFNIVKFDKQPELNRVDAFDQIELSRVFNDLGFKVSVETDLKQQEAVKKLLATARNAELKNYDALLIIFLSRGHKDGVLFSDSIALPSDLIFSMFTITYCPSMAKKPKLFIFNCFQDDSTLIENFNIPKLDYALACYATKNALKLEGDNESGPCFCNVLTKSLQKNVNLELEDIFKNVNRDNETIQMIEWIYLGKKFKLFFNNQYKKSSTSYLESPSFKTSLQMPVETSKTKEINILLFGETGVGKSTFINALANYLSYETLEEAEKNELIWLIPTKFVILNNDYKVQNIKCGEIDKKIKPDESETQACKCYVLPVDNYLIRFIDTPGIGDVRGIEHDKKTMENLMSFLSQYTDLDAICILMKPNIIKMTSEFQYCFKILLRQLSKPVSQNILFVFTNTRGTLYKPGDSMKFLYDMVKDIANDPPKINILLNENTIFCLDNESFRFLLAINNNINFSSEVKQNFLTSWDKSFKECMRLINIVISNQEQTQIKSRNVKETLSVNELKQAIINLFKPLVEITQNIQDNLRILEQGKQEIEDNIDDIETLKTKLHILNILELRFTPLQFPATVCAHKDCVSVYQVAGLNKWRYEQRCHPECFLDDVPHNIVGDPSIKKCLAMQPSENTCNKCQHEFQFHMHLYYECETVEKQIENVDFKRQIIDKLNAKTASGDWIINLEKKKQVYENEQNIIIQSAAMFGYFLRVNAITTYNDLFINYIEHLIWLEKSVSNNREKVYGLENVLKRYDKENQIISINMAKAKSNLIHTDEVLKTIKQLFNLKQIGEKIKLPYQMLKEAKIRENNDHRQIVYKPTNVIKSLKNTISFIPVKIVKLFDNLDIESDEEDLDDDETSDGEDLDDDDETSDENVDIHYKGDVKKEINDETIKGMERLMKKRMKWKGWKKRKMMKK